MKNLRKDVLILTSHSIKERMVDPLVTIIIPVYNAEKYLEKCLNSVLNQTMSEIEVIVVNDGSKDSSEEMALKYSRIDPRLRVITQENSGPSAARNRGLREAKGEYICFYDADDWVLPEAVAELYSVAERTNADIVISSYYRVVGNFIRHSPFVDKEQVIGVETEKRLLYQAFVESKSGIIPIWNKIYRKELLLRQGIAFDEGKKNAEDFLFNLMAFTKAKTITIIPNAFYYYNEDTMQSLTRSYRKNDIDTHVVWRSGIMEYMKLWAIDNVENKRIINRQTIYWTLYALTNLYSPKNKDGLPTKNQEALRIMALPEIRAAFSDAKYFDLAPIARLGAAAINSQNVNKLKHFAYLDRWLIRYPKKVIKMVLFPILGLRGQIKKRLVKGVTS